MSSSVSVLLKCMLLKNLRIQQLKREENPKNASSSDDAADVIGFAHCYQTGIRCYLGKFRE